MSRAEQVINENKKIDKLIDDIKKMRGDNLNHDDVNALTMGSINKQLVDISITMAMIYDLLNKKEI